jgi:hypothetical protein
MQYSERTKQERNSRLTTATKKQAAAARAPSATEHAEAQRAHRAAEHALTNNKNIRNRVVLRRP